MPQPFRSLAILSLLCLGFAPHLRAATVKTVYTPGYFYDKADFKKVSSAGKTSYLYYHDYAVEQSLGQGDPSISPYSPSENSGGISVYSTAGQVFSVTDNQTTSAGRYVSAWYLYPHPYSSYTSSKTQVNGGGPRSVTVNYTDLKNSTYDLIPVLNVMSYTLAYHANGGVWTQQPSGGTYLWTNRLTVATLSGAPATKTGHRLTGLWNTRADGTGIAVQAGTVTESGGRLFCIDNGSVDANGCTNLTLYAQWTPNKYKLRLRPGSGIAKICYKVNGASTYSETGADKDVDVTYGTVWSAYAEAKPGYTYTATSADKPESRTMGTDGDTFTPEANAKTFTVSFNGNGQTSGSTSEKTFTRDTGDYLPGCGFVRGYRVTFSVNGGTPCDQLTASYPLKPLCWNDEADGSGDFSYSDQQMVTNPCNSTGEAVMLYAQWDTNSVTPVTLPSTEKTGCSFAGWYNGSERVGGAGDKYVPASDVTLEARWGEVELTVVFYDENPDDGGTPISSQSVSYGQSATEPDHPTKDYYKFAQWNTDAWKSVTEDNLKVWPLWNGKEYWLKMWRNHSDQDAETETSLEACGVALDTKRLEMGDPWSDYAFEDKPGHTFGYWAENRSGTGRSYDKTEELTYKALNKIGGGKETVDFYAIWSPNSYKVRFNGGDKATGTMGDQSFVYDVPQALTKNAFEYAGQDFLGWLDEANNRLYDDGAVVSNLTAEADGIVNLSAVWSNYHYVRFDRNGATNETEMSVQKFSGAETTNLYPNAYGKVGYAFAGWATNDVSAANLCVAYTNGQAASFPSAQPNETNALYAVWEPNRYVIAFDPGNAPERDREDVSARRYLFGTMDPITNCWYDVPVTIACGYTNYCSEGLLGWSTNAVATNADFKVTSTSPVIQGADAIVSNLTAVANATQTLYAVWADIGELSKAAGLSNAVLYSSQCAKHSSWQPAQQSGLGWDTNHNSRVACACDADGDWGARAIEMKSVGCGWLRFRWCARGDFSSSTLTFNWGEGATNLFLKMQQGGEQQLGKRNWDDPVSVWIGGNGEHLISWMLEGRMDKGYFVAIDDVTWTPGSAVAPGEELPTYETEEEARAAAAGAVVVPPNDEVKGACAKAGVTYGEMFVTRAVTNATPTLSASGPWTLAIELEPVTSNAVQLALDAAASNLVEKLAGGAALRVTLPTKAGLYYGIAATNEIEWLNASAPTNWTLGTGKSLELGVDPPSDRTGFFEPRMTLTVDPGF